MCSNGKNGKIFCIVTDDEKWIHYDNVQKVKKLMGLWQLQTLATALTRQTDSFFWKIIATILSRRIVNVL